MELVFLTASKPLVKRYHAGGVEPFPRVSKMTSHHHEVPHWDHPARLDLYREYAAKGACLLKGTLIRPLVNESRAGATDTQLMRPTVILDFDGVPVDGLPATLTRNDLSAIAEPLVEELPEAFHDVSYLCRASSSMGMKPGRASLHLEFALDKPVAPGPLKQYLTRLNFLCPTLDQRIGLSTSGNALTFGLDPCLADNSRLIYIGTPVFDGRDNPIPNTEHRQFLVEKDLPGLDLLAEFGRHKGRVDNLKQARVRDLRDAEGLPRKKFHTEIIKVDGRSIEVVTNPDLVSLNAVREHERSVTYNVGNGDSNAYYVFKDNPAVVHNWKGEPPFAFEAADPEAYQRHIEHFGIGGSANDEPDSGPTTDGAPAPSRGPGLPLVFRDIERNVLYNGLYDAANDTFNILAATSRQEIGDFMRSFSGLPPDTVPQWNLRFEPSRPEVLNAEERFVNLFNPPPLLKYPPAPPEGCDTHPAIELLEPMREHCPVITRILLHMVGDGEYELNYFLNWLAYIIQFRKKTRTAWLFHGTFGTGKGVLQNHILYPLFSSKYVHYTLLNNLEDEFNGWCEQTLITLVDEFKMTDAKNSSKLENRLKNWIHEPTISIRKMRVGQYDAKNYMNFLFFSNEHDPLKIRDGDRRFNIAPRQLISLNDRYGQKASDAMVDHIPEELSTFAGLLIHARVDHTLATKSLDNNAKRELAASSQSSVDLFYKAADEGDLGYFEPVMDPNADNNPYQEAARNVFRAWLNQMKPGQPMVVLLEELRMMYNVQVGSSDNAEKFRSMYAKRSNNRPKRLTKDGVCRPAVEIQWRVNEIDLARIKDRYFDQRTCDFASKAKSHRPST